MQKGERKLHTATLTLKKNSLFCFLFFPIIEKIMDKKKEDMI